MPYIIINDSEGKEQMRSNMREHMRRNYKGGSWVSSGNYKSYPSEHYRTDEAYREGYEHGYRDGSYDESEERMRRRNSMGRFV